MAPHSRHRFRTGSGRLCLDLVRTLRNRGTAGAVEELPDPPALLAWINQCGPVHATAATPGDATTAQILREAIVTLITATHPVGAGAPRLGAAGLRDDRPGGGHGPVAVGVARQLVNRAAGAGVPVPSLGADGELRWRADEPVTATLSLVARDALDLVTSGTLRKVRECANPECGALFVDSSRPGMRRWCSMGTCGNRAKKQRAAIAR